MQIDTGSGFTIISQDSFDQNFLPEALTPPPKEELSSYTSQELNILGHFRAFIRYEDRAAIGDLLVADKGSDLLGRDLLIFRVLLVMLFRILVLLIIPLDVMRSQLLKISLVGQIHQLKGLCIRLKSKKGSFQFNKNEEVTFFY